MDLLLECRDRLRPIVEEAGLLDGPVVVTAGPLPPGQAIGRPRREDFLLRGREVMVEATFQRSRGQAYAAVPAAFQGMLAEALVLDLEVVANRAIFTAAANAVLHHLGRISRTQHCRDDGPEQCALQAAEQLWQESPAANVGLVGYQPALLEHLARRFGTGRVRVTDLGTENVGHERCGVLVRDGALHTAALVEWADLLLVTGSTAVNGTAGAILSRARQRGIEPIFFGVTAAGPAHLLDLRRLCPEGQG